MKKCKWISFAERFPAPVAALDDPDLTVTPKVMVTNNIEAVDRMGRQSHVWYTMPQVAIQNQNSWPSHYSKGDIIAFDDIGRVITNLTHWFDPFAGDEEVQCG